MAGVTTLGRGNARTHLDLKKDPVQTKLHTAVCKCQVTFAAAPQAIVTDWTTALTALHSADEAAAGGEYPSSGWDAPMALG